MATIKEVLRRMEYPKITDLFDLKQTIAAPYLCRFTYPHEALAELASYIRALGATLPADRYTRVGDDVWIEVSAKVHPSAVIGGPTIICAGAEVRPSAYIRGSAIVGEGAVVGNSTELKNAILFNSVQVPHFNYVGDSIYGYRAHTGAGAIASNMRSDKKNVTVRAGDERVETGLRKLGAMLGDYAEVGCNSVLCPGCVVGRNSIVYPLTRVRGVIPPHSIVKGDGTVVPMHE